MEIAAMSPPVSPQRRRDRGSGSIEPKGLTHSRKAASQPEKAVETRKPEIAAMSPPVSPQRRRDRGSGSLEPRGLTHSREAAFLQGWKSCNVDSFKPLRLRHLPYPRSARQRRTLQRSNLVDAISCQTIRAPRGRGGHCYASVHTLTENTRISANTQRRTLLRFHFQQRTTAYLPTSQFPKPSTLNPKP